jgi:hypothetical protein
MLVAKRDPFHAGAHDASFHPGVAPHAGGAAPRLARAMGALQIVGTLLAIPVGIGSAYSMYRANFSVDTTCQNLRANIISMIDKKIDAGTRHMLVRRDVETFEKTCGGFDPDAEAAFKTLLATDKMPAAVAVAPRTEAPAKVVARKPEPHPAVAVKQPPANVAPVAAEVEPVRHEVAVPDDKWLGAVRSALVAHEPEQAAPAKAEEPAVANVAPASVTPTVVRPVPQETHAAKPPEVHAAKPPEVQAAKPSEAQAAKPPEAQAAKPPEAHVAKPPEVQAAKPPEVQAAKPSEAQAAKPPEVQAAKPPEAQAAKPPEAQAAKPPEAQAAKPPEAQAAKPSETQVVNKTPAPAATLTPAAPVVAPELPPGTSVAAAPSPQAVPDHPVPPESIPEVTASASDGNAASAEHGSRFGWVSHIPLLGAVLDR